MNKSKKLFLSVLFLVLVCTAALGYALSPLASPAPHPEQLPAEALPPLPTPENKPADPVRIPAKNLHRPATTEELEQFPQLTNLPTLYIDFPKGQNFRQIEKGVYKQATYTLVDGGEGIFRQSMEIAGRGNYSWTMDKKPYAVKLGAPADLLGMGAARRWVLIANWSDKTLMRNYATLTFARNIGLDYTPECRYVDLFFNGKYHGNYLLTEKIEIDEQRVNVPPDGALFEIEREFRHAGNCDFCIECPSGVHVIFKEPAEDAIGFRAKKAALKKFRVLFVKADVAMTRGYDHYSRFIDVDSFIDWYIVNEFVKNYDSGFTTSCYCYVDRDGKIHMGPVWDYDTCMGNQNVATGINPELYHVSEHDQSAWYHMLLQDEDFFRLLCERWTELCDTGMLEGFFQLFPDTDAYFHDSEVRNHEKWKSSVYFDGLRGAELSTYSHEDEVSYVINWMSARYNWLCDQWYLGEDKPYRETNFYHWKDHH